MGRKAFSTKTAIMKYKNKHISNHRSKLIKIIGVNSYFECSVCGFRFIRYGASGYSSPNIKWLNNETNEL